MDSSSGTELYPLHRCKTLHLVRHAQGVHIVAGEKDHSAWMSYDFCDAHVTPLRWKQHVQAKGISKKIELVLPSPLLRYQIKLEFREKFFHVTSLVGKSSMAFLLALSCPKGKSGHPAVSSLNCPPFITVELCREDLGVHPLFPAVDFSLIESADDVLRTPDVSEKNKKVAVRGKKFLNWLWTRKEKEIAIVSCSGFFYHALSSFGNDCHSTVKSEICADFANCELLSVVIVDRSMMGSDSSRTNYPGRIPSVLDLPSEDKHPEMAKDN